MPHHRPHDALRNKGTAATPEERRTHGIEAGLPPRVETLEDQVARVLANLPLLQAPLDRYRYLSAVRDENETLFYRTIVDHLDDLLPLVYTPTVGEACTQWSRIYERPRGLYLSAFRHRGRVAELLRQWPRPSVGVIVVTDGGRILGLGDLGVNGMGIPIGKLSLYTACAGVPPALGLPITLDVGTDRDALRDDPLYLGERRPRLVGTDYDAFVDEFVAAVRRVFPGVVLQFEDFNNANAFRLLARHRDALCCFNDDVQGTGAMGLAGLLTAGRLAGVPLVDQRVLFVGAGEACLGIGATLVAAMQRAGLSDAEAHRRCLFMDSRGLVVTSRADLPAHKRPFAQDRQPERGLEPVITAFAPTALVGASGQPGLFTPDVLAAMARVTPRPIVFALSNPTSKAECTAEQAYAHTGGRAVFAGGSPFAPVTLDGRTHVPGQANNSFVFPGVGLGLLVSGARTVTDGMFHAAAAALADCVTDDDLAQGRVFPPPTRMRTVAQAVAIAVATEAWERQVTSRPRPHDVGAAVRGGMWVPVYG